MKKVLLMIGGVLIGVGGTLLVEKVVLPRFKKEEPKEEEEESTASTVSQEEYDQVVEALEDAIAENDVLMQYLEENGVRIKRVVHKEDKEQYDEMKKLRNIMRREGYVPEEEEEESYTDDEEETMKEFLEREAPSDDIEDPYIIDEQDFAENHIHDYVKCLCEYFQKDGALVDAENGAIYEDLSVIGGLNMINIIENTKSDIIYIRNEKKEADFCITKKRGSYKDKWG